jgi:hypothetical protein
MKALVRTVAVTFVTVCAIGLPSPSAADCPLNGVMCASWDGVVIPTTSPAYGEQEGETWTYGHACACACYDLREGYLVVRAVGGDGIYDPMSGSVQVADVYTIEGLPEGSSYSFTAELHVTTTTPDSSGLSISIAEPVTGAEQSFQGVTHEPSATRILSIPLNQKVGASFTIHFELRLSGFRETGGPFCMAEGHIFFRGLPAKARVMSCQAYNVPVPVRSLSWGALKSSYR